MHNQFPLLCQGPLLLLALVCIIAGILSRIGSKRIIEEQTYSEAKGGQTTIREYLNLFFEFSIIISCFSGILIFFSIFKNLQDLSYDEIFHIQPLFSMDIFRKSKFILLYIILSSIFISSTISIRNSFELSFTSEYSERISIVAISSTIIVILYCIFIVDKYKVVVEMSFSDIDVPDFLYIGIYVLLIFLLILAFFSYLTIYWEKINLNRIISSMLFTFSIIILLLSLALLAFSEKIKTNIGKKCTDVIHLGSTDFWKDNGIPTKYTFEDLPSLNEAPCHKEEIREKWDNHKEGNTIKYGCINLKYCNLANNSLSIFIYMQPACVFILALITFYNYKLSENLIKNFRERGRRYFTLQDMKRFTFLPLFILILIFTLLFFNNYTFLFGVGPKLPSFTQVKNIKSHFLVSYEAEELKLNKVESFKVANITLNAFSSENSSQKPIQEFVYHVYIQSFDGTLFFDKSIYKITSLQIDQEGMDQNPNHFLKFRGKIEACNKALQKIWFKPGNPIKPTHVYLSVKARYEPNFQVFSRRILDNDFYQNEDPLFEMFNRSFDYTQYLSSKEFKINGQIVHWNNSQYEPLDKGVIEIKILNENYTINTTYADHIGKFEILLPVIEMQKTNRNIQYFYNVQLQILREGYSSESVLITVGKSSSRFEANLGTVILERFEANKKFELQGKVYNAIDQSFIHDCYININNRTDIASDDNGSFVINYESDNTNILNSKAKGFLEFKRKIYSSTKHIDLALTPKIRASNIRITLSWQANELDLDLISSFLLDSERECKVRPEMRMCGGVILRKEDNKGISEVMDIKTRGPYLYLFYVHKRAGTTSLINSKAIIDIFTKYSIFNSFSISIPVLNEDTKVINKEKYWLLFCMKGEEGIESIVQINNLSENEPSYDECYKYMKSNE